MAGDRPTRPGVREVLDRYVAAFARRDVAAVVRLHSPAGTFHLHLDEPTVVGRAAIADRFRSVFALWPDLDLVTHRELLGEDFWVLDWSIVLPATNGRDEVRVDCHDVVVLDGEGLVLRKDTFVDRTQLARALAGRTGTAPSNPNPALAGGPPRSSR